MAVKMVDRLAELQNSRRYSRLGEEVAMEELVSASKRPSAEYCSRLPSVVVCPSYSLYVITGSEFLDGLLRASRRHRTLSAARILLRCKRYASLGK